MDRSSIGTVRARMVRWGASSRALRRRTWRAATGSTSGFGIREESAPESPAPNHLHRITCTESPAPNQWWAEQDSNLRRLCHQIYSLAPLAARESARGEICDSRPARGSNSSERETNGVAGRRRDAVEPKLHRRCASGARARIGVPRTRRRTRKAKEHSGRRHGVRTSARRDAPSRPERSAFASIPMESRRGPQRRTRSSRGLETPAHGGWHMAGLEGPNEGTEGAGPTRRALTTADMRSASPRHPEPNSLGCYCFEPDARLRAEQLRSPRTTQEPRKADAPCVVRFGVFSVLDLEPAAGIEPATACLQGRCSTIEPHRLGSPG